MRRAVVCNASSLSLLLKSFITFALEKAMLSLCSIIASLPIATQRLVALLFGTWFRVVNHCEYNAMTSEALAKSVAGSIFHTCATEPTMVSNAVHLIRVIIDNFGQPAMLGNANVQYFTDRTSTAIKVREKFKYRLGGRCPLVTTDDTSDTLRVECGTYCLFKFAVLHGMG